MSQLPYYQPIINDMSDNNTDVMFISEESNKLERNNYLYPLFSTIDCSISPYSHFVVPVNIRCQFPKQYCMIVVNLIAGLISTAGVIDSDYRGELMVICYNYSKETMIIKKEENIGQVVMLKCWLPSVERKSLGQTDRGEGKFGSTGYK